MSMIRRLAAVAISAAMDANLANALSGKGTPERAEPKVGRNAPCPCGCGKKAKKCVGKAPSKEV